MIALLKSLLTSLMRFTILKNSIFKTKKLNREVNRLFNRAIELVSCFLATSLHVDILYGWSHPDYTTEISYRVTHLVGYNLLLTELYYFARAVGQ